MPTTMLTAALFFARNADPVSSAGDRRCMKGADLNVCRPVYLMHTHEPVRLAFNGRNHHNYKGKEHANFQVKTLQAPARP